MRKSSSIGMRRAVPPTSHAANENGMEARGTRRGEVVYNQLREGIRRGALRPGSRLRETEIARDLGVSRTPVREALKRLQAEGLVVFNQPRGLIVNELVQKQILELYAMREVLGGAAARFAGEQASRLEIDDLQKLAHRQRSARTPEEAADANRRLHEAIANAAHNEYLLRAMTVLSDALSLLGNTTYSVPGRMESGARENEQIVDAIARKDPDAAEATARAHIRAAGAIRLAMRFRND